MNDAQKNTLISWLNDAHAMELALVKDLEGKRKDAEDAGEVAVAARIEAHISETERYATDVAACVERLGGNTSAMKNVMGRIAGFADGMMTSMFKDTMVKNALQAYAAEALEIASYTSLIAAAEALGDTETAEVCSRILEDEVEMSEWVLSIIPDTTETHILAETD